MSKNFEPSTAADALAARFSDRNAGGRAEAKPSSGPRKPITQVLPASLTMTTRSWYLPTTTADALTAAAEKLRQTVPALTKHEALAALLEHAVANVDQVATTLLDARTPPGRTDTA